MLGWGIALFIPNLKVGRAALAGAVGGILGAAAFVGVSCLGNAGLEDVLARCVGAAILGFCIGLMVAIVEAICREAWLEVFYSPKECKTFSLGRQPVTIGSGPECTVYIAQSPPMALRYVLEDGRIRCSKGGGTVATTVRPGDQETIGSVRVVVQGTLQMPASGQSASGSANMDLWLRISHSKRYRLAVGVRLAAKELPGVLPRKAEGPAAEVVANPKEPAILGLKNLSKSIWSVTLPEGGVRQIEPGQSIQLRVGLKINFGELRAEITG
jgi:hypothetical protein